MRSTLTAALSAIALKVAGAGTTTPLDAQTVRPAVVEYQATGRGKYELVNETLFPMTVVLEPRGFRVEENGDLVDEPFDSANVDLRLSAMSFRIPPLSSYTVYYEAKAKKLPAWFMVLGAMSGARTENGLNLRIELPHVIYLLQKESLRKDAVLLTGFSFDSVERKATFELENNSDALGRVIGSEMSIGGVRGLPFGGFPLFPRSRRRVEVPWEGTGEPDKVVLRFANFTVEERRRTDDR
ncbi:MAG: hypothetical protein ACT4OZ_06750 [Gemmatimonadota bacterium]